LWSVVPWSVVKPPSRNKVNKVATSPTPTGNFAGQWRISKCGRSLLRWALYHAAMGLAPTREGWARLAALKAKRQRDRFAGFKAIVELAAKVLRIV